VTVYSVKFRIRFLIGSFIRLYLSVMANTYSQINIQCVFAVKGRDNFITKSFRDNLHKQMSGILKNDNAFPLAVGGWLDHVHVFFELPPNIKISDLMRDLKASSSKWINDRKLVTGKFQWQEGYGAFSYSRSQRDQVINYIMNQEDHHKSKTFWEEYLELLRNFDIEFKDEYVFEFYDVL
jgi:putative transposase